MERSIFHVFREFLRDNGCLQQFDRNFYTQSGANRLDETLAAYMVIDEAFLNRCFDWSHTPEGREYWKGIDEKWWNLFFALQYLEK